MKNSQPQNTSQTSSVNSVSSEQTAQSQPSAQQHTPSMSASANACDYVTPSEFSSIFGSTISQSQIQVSPELSCQYDDTSDKSHGVGIVMLGITAKNDPNVNVNNPLISFPANSTSLQGIGEKAVEIDKGGSTSVYFFKNGTMMLVSVDDSVAQASTKAEALAKVIANKL